MLGKIIAARYQICNDAMQYVVLIPNGDQFLVVLPLDEDNPPQLKEGDLLRIPEDRL